VVNLERLKLNRPDLVENPDPDAIVIECILRRLEALETSMPGSGGITEEERIKTCVFQQGDVTQSGQCLTSR
jgi:hypothetical protein